jgi:hypothetical protein
MTASSLGDTFLFHLQKRLNTHTALQASRATIALTHTHNQVYFEPWKTDLQERRQGYSISAFFQPGSARAAVAHNGHMVNSGSIGPTSVRQTIRFECQRLINPGAHPLGARLVGNERVSAAQNAFRAQGARLGCAWTEREGLFGSENYKLPKIKAKATLRQCI